MSNLGYVLTVRLSTRLILGNVFTLSAMALVLGVYFVLQHRADVSELNHARDETMNQSVRAKGQRRVRILSAVTRHVVEQALVAGASANLPFLSEVIEATVANDRDTIYGIIMDTHGTAIVHTDASMVGRMLADGATAHAARNTDSSTEIVVDNVLDTSAPIWVNGVRWGTIRFGVTLAPLDEALARSAQHVERIVRQGLLAMIAAAAVSLALGSATGAWIARRLLHPLRALGAGVRAVRQGDFSTEVVPAGSPELRELADGFNAMTSAIANRERAIGEQLEAVARALRKEEETNRLKSSFIANVSHELRTPLNAIVNVPSTLLSEFVRTRIWRCDRCGDAFESDAPDRNEDDDAQRCPQCEQALVREERFVNCGDEERQRRALVRLEQSSRHLLALVNDLLDFSKLEAGRMTLAPTELRVDDLLSSIEQTMRGLAEANGHRLTIERLGGPATIRADELRLRQVLMNLVGNAIKFTPKDGTINITADATLLAGKAAVLFSVLDSGPGIAAADVEVVFERFRQLDDGHTRQHGGTGLGLAISRQIVELHGGRIWCEPAAGRGGVFRFALPIVDDHTPLRAT